MFFFKKASKSAEEVFSIVDMVKVMEDRIKGYIDDELNEMKSEVKDLTAAYHGVFDLHIQMKRDITQMYLLAQEACQRANQAPDLIQKLIDVKKILDNYQIVSNNGEHNPSPNASETGDQMAVSMDTTTQ